MLVSIIIPIYNAQTTLERCLKSVKAQIFKDYEVVLINDGSTDDSEILCDQYAKLYQEFKVIHISNAGVSNARNVGIDHSHGKYLSFVDADDELIPDYLSILLNKNDIDFALCGYKTISPDSTVSFELIRSMEKLNRNEVKNIVINHHLARTVWGKIFLKSTITEKGLRFDTSLKLAEDTIFVLNFLRHANSIAASTSWGYIYYQAPYNINRYNSKPEELLSILENLIALEKHYQEQEYEIGNLRQTNWQTISFYFFNVVYAPKAYSRVERRNYYYKIQRISNQKELTFINSIVNKLFFRPLISLGIYNLIDASLFTYFRLLRLKKSLNNNESKN